MATSARRKKLKEREAKEASGGSTGGGSFDGAFLGEEGDEWAEPRFQATEAEVSFQDPVPLERPALYVVSVPIGNLGDITLRALRVLREVDAIFAEDTRTTDTLLRRLGIEGSAPGKRSFGGCAKNRLLPWSRMRGRLPLRTPASQFCELCGGS